MEVSLAVSIVQCITLLIANKVDNTYSLLNELALSLKTCLY
jgi:hypothetical protein